jgi:hypothetical protein
MFCEQETMPVSFERAGVLLAPLPRFGDQGVEKSLTYDAYGAASSALHGDGILSPWYCR